MLYKILIEAEAAAAEIASDAMTGIASDVLEDDEKREVIAETVDFMAAVVHEIWDDRADVASEEIVNEAGGEAYDFAADKVSGMISA